MRRFAHGLGRSGMTLVEVLAALLVLGMVVSVAFSFIQQQAQAVQFGDEQMLVLQNQRFAANTLERDLRSVGTGVPAGQPFLVYADSHVVAFNADLVTRDPNDRLSAVYVDRDASAAATVAATQQTRFRIPGTGVSYPDTSYLSGGVNSPAETVIFFVVPDSASPRADDFVLMRQVNHLPAEVVARDLVRSQVGPFFQYYRVVTPPQGAMRLELIPANRQLFHSVRRHGSAADVGAAALVDSVRAVRINLEATNGLEGEREQSRTLTRLVRLPNAGLKVSQTCGAKPVLGSALAASASLVGGEPVVQLQWGAAVDEGGGERDVLRYVIWRAPAPTGPWEEPYSSVAAAGLPSYAFEDYDVVLDSTYHYAVAAQDCTPALSGLTTASATTPPPPPP